jgi:ubiquinone/menaquinone biosynthesis C-methylase UbiE
MYDERADFSHHEREIRNAYAALAQQDLLDGGAQQTVLDLGGGQGMHAGFLSQTFGRVYCADRIDYSSLYGGEFIKLLAEKHGRHGRGIRMDRVAFVQSDAMALIFRDAMFDGCLCINVFEHVPDPRRALAEIVRVLTPGGWAYISFDPIWTTDTGSHFFHRVPEPWGHLVHGDERYARMMLAAGAEDLEVTEYRTAMNRWRLSQFREVFDDGARSRRMEICARSTWSGPEQKEHLSHPNLARLHAGGTAAAGTHVPHPQDRHEVYGERRTR